ncbi:hypothetical protein HYE67_000055 [Fusarium culmorum]|uniref:Uncharacterized protein n=1 Tax=Fusarium culmorum TaxID=5516 RepID=A0A7S8CWV6_FUSCU|nr:hypothetical protein HYE67_000055 [Fusarium culmorum]
MKTRRQIGQVSAQEVTQEAKRKHRAYIQTNLITAYIDDMRRRHAQAVAKIDIATEAKKESDEVLRVYRAKRESADKIVQAKTDEVTILTDHLAVFSSDYQRRHSGIGMERDKLDNAKILATQGLNVVMLVAGRQYVEAAKQAQYSRIQESGALGRIIETDLTDQHKREGDAAWAREEANRLVQLIGRVERAQKAEAEKMRSLTKLVDMQNLLEQARKGYEVSERETEQVQYDIEDDWDSSLSALGSFGMPDFNGTD